LSMHPKGRRMQSEQARGMQESVGPVPVRPDFLQPAAVGDNWTASNVVANVAIPDDGIECGLMENNVDYWGGDLQTLQTGSALACSVACGANAACKSYTFAVSSGYCYLKSLARPGHSKNACCVSGTKPCADGAPPHTVTTTAPPAIYHSEAIRGIAYGALPCKGACTVSEDMLQEGYQALWGPSPGRDDLGVIKGLGANTVRLYHSIGLDGRGSHGLFLDYAETLGLKVMPGYHTYNAIYGECPEFDCYQSWKKYTLKAFEEGFRRGDEWHPSVSMLLLFNELDFFRSHGKTAHLRSALSAIDGVLAAEREAGVKPGRVRLSITWSNAPGESLDKEVTGLAVWGFQDIAAGIANPSIVGYTPRSSQEQMETAYKTRWANGINVQTPGTVDYMNEHYHRFEPVPWYIGEYGANGMPEDAIMSELKSMDETARDATNPFMGMAFFQFQTAYFKGGSEENFGLFRLGDTKIAETGDICDKGVGCEKLPVYCLTTNAGDLPEFVRIRAEAVASVWGGSVDHPHMC